MANNTAQFSNSASIEVVLGQSSWNRDTVAVVIGGNSFKVNWARNCALRVRVNSGVGLDQVVSLIITIFKSKSVFKGVVRSVWLKCYTVGSSLGERQKTIPGHGWGSNAASNGVDNWIVGAEIAVPQVSHSPVKCVIKTISTNIGHGLTISGVDWRGTLETGNSSITRLLNINCCAGFSHG